MSCENNINNYLNENLNFAMDYDYWIRISKKYKLSYKNKNNLKIRFNILQQ